MQTNPHISNDPNLRLDMMRLLEQGETLTGIGRIYGVSRDRVRTQMKRFGLSKRPPFSEYSAEQVQTWADRIIKGETFRVIASELSVDPGVIRRYLEHYGHDPNEITKQRSLHRYDGMVYSHWTVLPGTHRHENNNTVLDCQCVCGVVRTVSLTNLMGGATKSCGCIGYFERQAYPWFCESTGETVINTSELARRTGINGLTLHRHAHKHGEVEDNDGNVWTIQLEKGVSPGLTRQDTIVWTNNQTNQVVTGCKAIAELTAGSVNTIKWYGNRRMTYTAKDGSIWHPSRLGQIT